MRVATYSRFSTEMQNSRSIADQQAECHAFAKSRGWDVVADFIDEAISGGSLHGRLDLANCISGAKAKRYDGILVDNLERLARSFADTASIYRDLTFHEIKLLTVADNGELQPMMLAIKAGIAENFLATLGRDVRRGQRGCVREGRIPGGKSYGYNMVPGDKRGMRTINADEAAIIRRIFSEYVSGRSPIQIVKDLNRQGVPSARGGKWHASTVIGNRTRANGVIHNSLYTGEIIYNRQRCPKNPTTGKKQSRPNPRGEWVRQYVPELRIIDEQTWNAAQAMRRESVALPLRRRQRPRRILSEKLKCLSCGQNFVMVRGDYCRCAGSTNGTCTVTKTVRMAEVEQRVLRSLQEQLMTPEMVEMAVQAYREE